MARSSVVLCVVLGVLLGCGQLAAAHKPAPLWGKGKGIGFGKGKGLSFTTECNPVCKDRCRFVATPVCADVQVPYEVCDKVPVTATVQRCGKLCSKAEVEPTQVVVPSVGKGLPLKGRHLLHGVLPLLGKGKGKGVAVAPIQCDVVCQDVPITKYTVQCDTKVRVVTQCKKNFQEVCDKVCRPVCVKVPVVETPAPVVATSTAAAATGAVIVVPPAQEQQLQQVAVVGKGKDLPLLGGKLGH